MLSVGQMSSILLVELAFYFANSLVRAQHHNIEFLIFFPQKKFYDNLKNKIEVKGKLNVTVLGKGSSKSTNEKPGQRDCQHPELPCKHLQSFMAHIL